MLYKSVQENEFCTNSSNNTYSKTIPTPYDYRTEQQKNATKAREQ